MQGLECRRPAAWTHNCDLVFHGAVVASIECTAALVWWYERPLTIGEDICLHATASKGHMCSKRAPKLALAGLGLSMVVFQASVCC